MLKYMDITNFEKKAKCKMCSNTADVFLKYNRQDGTPNLILCKKCFDKLRKDFAKGDIKKLTPEVIVSI